MSIKSSRLRFLITMHTLYKYTDRQHRINTTTLNEHLAPYGLEYAESKPLAKNIRAMREYGISVPIAGSFDKRGYWLEDKLISEETLHRLAFAVTTNPYLPAEIASELLGKLKPLVSVYDEPKLNNIVDPAITPQDHSHLLHTYHMIAEAIQQERRVRCRLTTQTSAKWRYIMPKCIYHKEDHLYLIGYYSDAQKMVAYDLMRIREIGLASRRNKEWRDRVNALMNETNVERLVKNATARLV